MQRLRFVLLAEARDSLRSIVDFLLRSGASRKTALGFVARIRARCERIGHVPLGGRPRDDLAPGLRTVPFEDSAVIAYVVRDDRVEIVDIFYGGRDYEVLYRDEGAPPGG